jgi:lysophospholipase L1-like esterase
MPHSAAADTVDHPLERHGMKTGRIRPLEHPFARGLMVILAMICTRGADSIARANENRWESAIKAFEQDDRETAYPAEAILFVGSSSIRLWDSLPTDMAPYPVVQRGFGGAATADVIHYADRLLGNHQPPAVVLFVANDIRGNAESDLSPATAADLFASFVSRVHSRIPDTTLFIVAVTPTASRWSVWPQIQKLNHLLARLCDETADTVFIPTADIYLGPNGRPRDELFRSDRLHLNAAGYAHWTKRIRSYLDPLLTCRER